MHLYSIFPFSVRLAIRTGSMVFIRNYTPRRALLYVPGCEIRKLDKAWKLDIDCVAMDCEDGVALNKKNEARETIRSILNRGKPKSRRNFDWGVRVNSVDCGLCEDDLKAILTADNLPDTLLLPKVDSVDDLKWFADKVNSIAKGDKKFELVYYIESATAVMNLPEICRKAEELSRNSKFIPAALVFGGDDFLANIGAAKTDDCKEILYARQKVVLVAKAFRLQAIDIVYIQYKDKEGLQRQCEEGARMGFTGKQCIHPDQVPVVQEAFLPNEKQIEWASGLLKAFEEHQQSGKGAFTYRGSMIDMPSMKQAQNIIDLIKTVKVES